MAVQKYTCKKACYWHGRYFNPGDTWNFDPESESTKREAILDHFNSVHAAIVNEPQPEEIKEPSHAQGTDAVH